MPEMTGNLANFTDRHGQNVEIDILDGTNYQGKPERFCITVDGRMTQNAIDAKGVIAWFANASHCEPSSYEGGHDPRGVYQVIPRGECEFDVVQRSSGVIIASAARRDTALQAAGGINACAVIPRMVSRSPQSSYQPFTEDSVLPAAEESYVLVRQRGNDNDDGFPHTPVVAQLVEGKFFTTHNGVKAVSWQKGDAFTENPYEANLEWMPLPK
jgi:hypothetical protein